MLVFAAETSCDETSICLMENRNIIDIVNFNYINFSNQIGQLEITLGINQLRA